MVYTGATNKFEVANIFATDKELITEVNRFFGYKNYVSDIVQDILLQILTTNDEDKLLNICKRNEFKFWLFRLLKDQKNNKKSYSNRFYVVRDYDQTNLNSEQNENAYTKKIDDEHRDYVINLLKAELIKIHKKNWYQFKVFTEYVDLKEKYAQEGKKLTFEEFGKEMRINQHSLFQVIKKVKAKLIKRINNEL